MGFFENYFHPKRQMTTTSGFRGDFFQRTILVLASLRMRYFSPKRLGTLTASEVRNFDFVEGEVKNQLIFVFYKDNFFLPERNT